MAYEAYISVEGTKSGKHKGTSTKKGRTDFHDVHSFQMSSSVPTDANNWKPKGMRQINPLRVTMEAGAASPLFLASHWTSEVLKKVVIEFVDRGTEGKAERVKERITLVDAVIVKVNRYSPSSAKEKVENDTDNLEDIHFRFRQITVENLIGSTSVTEDADNPGS